MLGCLALDARFLRLYLRTGMIAGRLSFSCRPTQKMKAGIRARAVERRAMLEGCFMSVVLPVMDLIVIVISTPPCRDVIMRNLHLRKNVTQHSQARTRNHRTNPINIILQLGPFRAPTQIGRPFSIWGRINTTGQTPERYTTDQRIKDGRDVEPPSPTNGVSEYTT